MIGLKDLSRRSDSGAKTIKTQMSIQSKTKQDQETHEHSSKMSKGCKHMKKPMSIPAKTRRKSKNP